MCIPLLQGDMHSVWFLCSHRGKVVTRFFSSRKYPHPLKVLTLNPSHPSGNSSLMGSLQCIHHQVIGNRNTHTNSFSFLWKLLLEIITTNNIFFPFHRQFKPKASKIVINFASIDGPPSKPIWSISSP